MNLMAVTLGRNMYASGLGRDEARKPCHLDRRASVCLRYHEDAFCGVLGADQWIPRLWVEA